MAKKKLPRKKLHILAEAPRYGTQVQGMDYTEDMIGTREDTFIKEAGRIKKTLGDYDVNITPLYDEPAKLDSVLQSVKEGDEIAFLGHSGDRLFGMPLEDIGKALKKSPGNSSTFLGSCNSADMAKGLSNSSGKEVYGTSDKSWLGPNTKGKNILDVMYGVNYANARTTIGPSEPGKDYSYYNSDTTKNINPIPKQPISPAAAAVIAGAIGGIGQYKQGGKLMATKSTYKRFPIKKKLNTGGTIGGMAGSIIGSVIPGVGTMIGGAIGGGLGNLIGDQFADEQESPIGTEQIIKPVNPYINADNIVPMEDGGEITGPLNKEEYFDNIMKANYRVYSGKRKSSLLPDFSEHIPEGLSLEQFEDYMKYANPEREKMPRLSSARIGNRALKKRPYEEYASTPRRASLNVPEFENGGELTQYEGRSHEEEGMNIGPAEVEGGENEFMGIVNSDNIELTKGHINKYGLEGGGKVPITEKDIGKTPAQVADRINSKYDKFHEYDPFNVSQKEHLTALSMMSDELAEEMADNDIPVLRAGGRLRDKVVSPVQDDYFEYSNLPEFEDGGGLTDLLGYAPAITNLLQLGSEFGRGTEDISYPTIEPEEYTPLDPTQSMQKAGEGFDNAMEGLRRSGELSPAAMIQLATERGKTTNDIASEFANLNIQGKNRFSYINQRGKMFNATQQTREEIDTSANEAAKLSRMSAFGVGVGENLGQVGRDIRMTEANKSALDKQNEMFALMFPHYANVFGGTEKGNTPALESLGTPPKMSKEEWYKFTTAPYPY